MDEMTERLSSVYVLADERGRVLRCEGGYTLGNIRDLSRWTLLEEGVGDRFHLCQSHYFEGGLYTEDGVPRWEVVEDMEIPSGARAVLRTEEAIEADRASVPPPPPSAQDDADAMLVDHEYRLTLLELGLMM